MPDDTKAESGERTSHGLPSPKRRVGHYEIIRQIGRGGMATVYLARQVTLDRNVALKELSSFHAGSPEFAERFLRESRLAGSLNHPNVVTVLEYFEEGGTPFIAMEYVRGGSLRPYVGRLGLAQFAGVMEGVLAGLTHAETIGIVHRDLKPENLMVTSDGRVKIADFGIAKATQSAGTAAFLTATGTTVGTPTYMAPEQAMAGDIGPWTDLYSVGVMAYEHIVGQVPFHDTDAPMVILMRQVNEPIPPAADMNGDIDQDISDWIDRLLVKDPSKRTQSAIDAWEQLEEIVIGLLGPRWRREARLPEHVSALDTPRALTPAPFSVKTPAPPPASGAGAAAPAIGSLPEAAPAPPADPEYLTFGAPAPAPAADIPVAPAAEGSVAAAAVAAAAGAAIGAPAAATTPEPPSAPAAPSVPALEATGLTAPEARAAQAPPAPEPAAPEADDPYRTYGKAAAPAAGAGAVAAGTQTAAAGPEAAAAIEAPPAPAPEPAATPDPAYVTYGSPAAPPTPAEPAAPLQPPAPEPAPSLPEPILSPAPRSETMAPAQVAPEPVPPEPRETAQTAEAAAPAPLQPGFAPKADPEPKAAPSADRASAARSPRARPARAGAGTARRVALVALLAAIVAGVIGFVIAPSKSTSSQPSGPPLVGSASAGPLAISFPTGWTHAPSVKIAHLPLTNQLAVNAAAPNAGTLVMGTAGTSDASLLPASFVSALSSPPAPQVVTLGKAQFYRYLDLTPAGASGPETVYALPTSAGSVIAVCQASSGSPTFASTCERVVGTLQVTGTVFGLGPSPAYASGLSGVMTKLASARSGAQTQLASAKTPAHQASAANHVSAAYRQAAGSVQKLGPTPSAQDANAAIAAALVKIAGAYTALGKAAGHHNGGGYAKARAAINGATGQLGAALKQLTGLGYTIG